MIDTQTSPQHLYPHESHPEGIVTDEDLRVDFANYPKAYHNALHPHIEAHLGKVELERAVAEKGDAYSRRLTDLLDPDVSGYVSREQIVGVLDELRDENDELVPDSMRLVVDTAKSLWSKGQRVPAVFYDAMAERPDLLTTMVEQVRESELNDWDGVAVRKIITGTADKLEQTQNAFSHLDSNPFSNEPPPEPSPEEQARIIERQRMAAQLKEIAAEFPEPPYAYDDHESTTRELFTQYGQFASEGISIGDAYNYERLVPSLAKGKNSLPVSSEQIKNTLQKFGAAGEDVQMLYLQGGNHPLRLAAIQPFLEQIVAKGGDDTKDRLKQFVDMAGGGYADETYSSVATSVINRLSASGASADNLLYLIGDSRMMHEMINHGNDTDPEQYEQSLNLLAQLGRHEMIAFIDESDDGGHEIVRKILADPAEYAEYIGTIDGLVDEVAASGFPARLTADKVLERFSQYYGNRGIDDDIAYIKDALLYQQSIGGSAQILENVSPVLATQLINGGLEERVSTVDITEAAAAVAALKKSYPDVYKFMEQQITYSNDMAQLRTRLAIAGGFIDHAELFTMLDERESQERSLDSYRNNIIYSLKDSQEDTEAVMNRFAQLEKGVSILADRRLKGFRTVASRLFESPNPGEIIALLGSDSVQQHLDDPKTLDAVNDAMSAMLYDIGKYDVERIFTTFESIDDSQKEWLGDLIRGEARLRDKGLTDEQIIEYHGLFTEVMPRRDKDGNHYDDAMSVKLAMESTYGRTYSRPKGASAEALSWYRQAGMPIAGYGAVAAWRAEAVAAGVADSPHAVYEWLHKDPEQVARISAGNLTDYLTRKVHGGDEQAATKALATARQELPTRDEHFRVFMNISTQALTKVAESGGAIKSILDAGVEVAERGGDYDLHRSGVEIALGLRSMNDDTPHPIYGSCGFVDGEIPAGAVGYGDILLTFKETPELAARTSYTPEDSFHGADRLINTDAKLLRLAKDAKDIGHTRTDDYVEAQIQGSLDLASIDAIYVNSDEQRDAIAAVLPTELVTRIIVRGQSL